MPSNLLGIEIGGTKLQVVLGDSLGNIAQTLEVAANAAGGANAILFQLEAMARQLIASSAEPVCGIGIGFGGPVDTATGVIIQSNQVSGWEQVSLVQWAEAQFQLPAIVANDTDVATLAEARVGGGRNDRCVFYTNIGSGIGGGLVVDGKLFTRPGGSMEIGHNWVYSELDQKYGSLEEFYSGWALDRRASAALPDVPAASAASLFAAWKAGDAVAVKIVDDFLACYGRALANVIVLLNPDVIIIGGGVAQTGDDLLAAIRAKVQQFVYKPFAKNYRIEFTTLGKQAVPIGALLLAGQLADLEMVQSTPEG